MSMQLWGVLTRDVTKSTLEFDNVRTSNVFSRFEIRWIFSRTRRRIQTSSLHERHHMSTLTGHRNNQLNKCALPNSLKGPKIILDIADRHVSKDGPFRILGNALMYLHIYFRTFSVSIFFIFYHRQVNVWLDSHSHSNGFVLRNSHSTNRNCSWLRHIPSFDSRRRIRRQEPKEGLLNTATAPIARGQKTVGYRPDLCAVRHSADWLAAGTSVDLSSEYLQDTTYACNARLQRLLLCYYYYYYLALSARVPECQKLKM